ncbi:MAG: hypothetical protein ABIK82_03515 [Pseudomonadota bacterium]
MFDNLLPRTDGSPSETNTSSFAANDAGSMRWLRKPKAALALLWAFFCFVSPKVWALTSHKSEAWQLKEIRSI